MTPGPDPFPQRYQSALEIFLAGEGGCCATLARDVAAQAALAGVKILEFAKLHELVMSAEILPGVASGQVPPLIRRAAGFFAAVANPAGAASGLAKEVKTLTKVVETLSCRGVELAKANRVQALQLTRCKAAEIASNATQSAFAKSLKESELLKAQLRGLSRQILSAQEDERKIISRELHDVIAQTLIGINLRLATLKKEAEVNTKSLGRNIALTQRLVTKSANLVHQFARELRPPALDDLGLIPAMHAFLKNFTTRTGVRSDLTAYAAVEELDLARRTVLFRVAQEALTNVERHADASQVKVDIVKLQRSVRMTIADDGKSFNAKSVLLSAPRKRLGVLGMRERVEMVGGTFAITSEAGSGTTVSSELPLANKPRKAQAPAAAI